MDKPDAGRPIAIANLRQRARAALGNDFLSLELTMALPTAWPPKDSAVEFLAYQSDPLPTGISAYRIRGPIRRITLALPDGPDRVEVLAGETVLGTERNRAEAPHPSDLDKSEQALLDILAGVRGAEAGAKEMGAYLDWLRFHPIIGNDVRGRHREFFAWMDAHRK